MAESLRDALDGIGWSHVGLAGIVAVTGFLIYRAGVARGNVGRGFDYNRGRRW